MTEFVETPKDQFIASVRSKLGKTDGSLSEAYEPLTENLSSIEDRVQQTKVRLENRRADLVNELRSVAELRGWQTHIVESYDHVLDCIGTLVRNVSAKLVIRSDEDIFHKVSVDSVITDLGARVQIMTKEYSTDEDIDPALADIGITGSDYAIAETGTVVILPRKRISRLVSLLPPIHVALVRSVDVLESLDDLYLLRRFEYHKNSGNMGSYMNFITGPSRTADIEQTLVIGAHGPRETHMIIVTGE